MSFLKGFFTTEPSDNLRIIITRHGERADLKYGPGWTSRGPRAIERDSKISHLTPRSNFFEYEFDPPLTKRGEKKSFTVGKRLLNLGYFIDYCYTSPAYRSVQTAANILKAQGRDVPIYVEPGLFECPLWYNTFPLTFIPPEQLAMDPYFGVDASYSPIFDRVDPNEDEQGYYKRSRRFIETIVRSHKKTGGTILLSGHAGSIETLTRGIRRVRAVPENLYALSGKVGYSDFVVLERDAMSQEWVVNVPESLDYPYGGHQPIQTSMPLYRISSQPLLTQLVRAVYPPDYSARVRDKSYWHHHRYRHHHHSRSRRH